ncbi:MAG: hypothetical protein HZC55_20640 [Verrucomicrobia bacterium]|nr:hypothetical protein [Verrucomicrobiota bacterium]
MNRRTFLRSSTALSAAPLAASAAAPIRPVNRTTTAIGAYYLNAHMYTYVPRHIRADMEWMADIGTQYVCVGVLEQDLFAAYENHSLIAAEASRVGMKVIAVPSRWGGLTAGAPKVPSLFSMLNPQTLIVNKQGRTAIMPKVSGGISSVHHPDTLKFFCDTLAELYRQHPHLAGFIIDEPKCFIIDKSKAAVAALGEDAPITAHYGAARDFWSKVCAFAKQRWPDKLTFLFQQAHNGADELAAGAGVQHLDYYGADGRPWDAATDKTMEGGGEGQESGKGKILLSGKGESFLRAARAVPGRKGFFLLENHNLQAAMIDAMDRHYPAVLALRPDFAAYYYYPRNVQDPDRAMAVIARHVKRFTQG